MHESINFYDTALGYGKREQIVGKAFKDCRTMATICTKPEHLYDVYSGQVLPPNAAIKSKLERSIRQGLSKLQTDYLIEIENKRKRYHVDYGFHSGKEIAFNE